MSKRIFHVQIPVNENGRLLVNPELWYKFIKLMADQLGDEWVVLSSPGNPSVLSEGDLDKLVNLNVTESSMDELLRLMQDHQESKIQ